jgi:hypothetical protein
MAHWIDAARACADSKQAQNVRVNTDGGGVDFKPWQGNKRGWTVLDGVTANLLVQVVSALNEENAAKFLALPFERAVAVAWKLAWLGRI